MKRAAPTLLGVAVLFFAPACGQQAGGNGHDGGGHDAGIHDSGSPDSGVVLVDAGTPDAGGFVDAGTPDAGGFDAGTPDAGTPDAGTPDAGGSGYCNGLAEPGTASCCSSCYAGGGSCQANGCYGGWLCDPTSCYCQAPPSTCTGGGYDGGTPDGGGGGTTDGGPAPGCTTGGTWPTASSPVTCSGTGCYLSSQYSGRCGVWCWSMKTGTDSDASKIDLTQVVPTTIAAMIALTPPSSLAGCGTSYCNCPSSRTAPTETTIYELKNVHLSSVGLEADSDYHMDVDDGAGHDMVVEIPYPGCVGSSSVLGCNISHARAAVDAVAPPTGTDMAVDYPVTVIGVGFFDFVHSPPVPGSAANGIELHPVLRICFGLNCDPMASP